MLLVCLVSIVLVKQVTAVCTSTESLTATSYSPTYVRYPADKGVDYDKNKVPCWVITPDQSGQKILITIQVSEIGDNDVLVVHNAQNASNRITSVEKEVDFILSVVADAGAAFLEFDPDNTATPGKDKGFTFFFVTGQGIACDATLPASTEMENYLASPNFPDKYSLFSECTWTIEAKDPNANIELELKFLDMEFKPTCEYDSLQIIDDNGDGTDKICGTDWFPTFKYSSGGNTIQIKMLSDSINSKYGFILMYKSESDISLTLIIVSIVITSLGLIGCLLGSLYCVDKL